MSAKNLTPEALAESGTRGVRVAALLAGVRRGHAGAGDELFSLWYPELRQMAHSHLRRSGI